MTSERGGTLTREYRIAELLELIDQQQMVLPEFQRDFDWGDDRVRQLLATVARRWPAGSLLLQDFPGETFYQLRGFEGGPALDQARVRYVVLDGQQRLTALYHAVYDAGPYVFGIRSRALTPGASIDQLEDSIVSFSRAEWNAESRHRAWDRDHDWIPFYALRSPADFFIWRDELIARSEEAHRTALAAELSDAYRHGLEAFHTYALPAVIVERELEPAAIARIFERVNRGGLTLSAFDLMVAKTFETGWNLRDKWDEAKVRHPVLEDFFGDDGMPIIRAIALKSQNSIREGDVLSLPGLAVRDDWDEAVAATASALDLLVSRCGVKQPDWLPYGGMVITLAGLAFEFELSEHEDSLTRWFLSRAYGLRYDTAANTVTVEEYHMLRGVLRGEQPLRPVPIVGRILREATRKRRNALWRAFMATLALRNARDPLSGQEGTEHLVPTALLQRDDSPLPGTESSHLLVLNLLLVPRSSVGELKFAGPVALKHALDALDGDTRRAVCASQVLPVNVPPNAEGFLDARLQELERFLFDQLGYGFERETGDEGWVANT